MKIAYLGSALAIALGATVVGAEERTTLALPTAEDSDEIIVEGLRIPRNQLPTGVYWDYSTILGSQMRREKADLYLGCAFRVGNVHWLRAAVDGEPNSAPARFAQGRMLQYGGCYPPVRTEGAVYSNRPIGSIDMGVSQLDRGVIMELVIRTYAQDAALTPETVRDPAVRNRFMAREGFRNRLRLPEDRDSLLFASCLVEEQPVLATRLVRSEPGSPLERGLTQAVIVEGRKCVGNTERVTIDPSMLRAYIVDAFYRWVVAVRGAGSLIPLDPKRG